MAKSVKLDVLFAELKSVIWSRRFRFMHASFRNAVINDVAVDLTVTASWRFP